MLSSPYFFLMAMTIGVCIFWGEFVDYKSCTNAEIQRYNALFVSRDAYFKLIMVVDHPLPQDGVLASLVMRIGNAKSLKYFELGRFTYLCCNLV